MTRTRIFLIVQALLCVLLAALLIGAAAGIYGEGAALREAGNRLAWIYTPEKAWQRLSVIAPLFFLSLGMTVCGWMLDVRERDTKLPPLLPVSPIPAHPRGVHAVRVVGFIAAAALVVAGVLNGGLRDVLVKAINLCTECVGLG